MTVLVRLAVWLLGVCCAPLHAETLLHAASGVSLPDSVASFRRAASEDFERRQSGAGFSYRYESGPAVRASLFIYTEGISDLPASGDHPVLAKLHAGNLQAMLAIVQRDGLTQRPEETRFFSINTEPRLSSVLYDVVLVDSPQGKRREELWLWVARQHFFKLRLTYPQGSLSAEKRSAFLRTLIHNSLAAEAAPGFANMVIGVNVLSHGNAAIFVDSLQDWRGDQRFDFKLMSGLVLRKWTLDNPSGSPAQGTFSPPYAAELESRQLQLVLYREWLVAKPEHTLAYMDELLKVEQGGWLPEYLWAFHRRPTWGERPAGIRHAEFAEWSRNNLPDHAPQTNAFLVFTGP